MIFDMAKNVKWPDPEIITDDDIESGTARRKVQLGVHRAYMAAVDASLDRIHRFWLGEDDTE